ncbi:MAG: hypothetical protein KFF73_19880 [Cyclobacteriaceae bacterium]|nr:hypothetical protein [Cyclobacteriaceae bacterium]
MPAICFYFKAHCPYSIKKTSFFEFGQYPDLIDDEQNSRNISNLLKHNLRPSLEVLEDLIASSGGSFRFSMNVSGTLLDLVQYYLPSDYQSLSLFLKAKEIEPVISPYFSSAVNLLSFNEFLVQVRLHREKIYTLTGIKSGLFSNPDLTSNAGMADMIHKQQFRGMIMRAPAVKNGKISSGYIHRDQKFKNLKLILVNEKFLEIFLKAPFRKKNPDRQFLKKIVHEISRSRTLLILIPIDVHIADIQPESTARKLNFIKYFVEEAMDSGNIEFRKPSEVLTTNDPSVNLELSDKKDQIGSSYKNDTVLRKEAIRFLCSLEDKIKKAGDRELLYLWRIMQSTEHLDKMLLPENYDFFTGFPAYSMHEVYLEYMNALSCLDIYTRKNS